MVGVIGMVLLCVREARSQTTPTENPVEAIASYLEGIMDTTIQANNNSNFVGVQMTTCRLTVEQGRTDSVYLYQEQALSENTTEPYRQRFLQITPGEGDRTDSISYRPETSQDWIGLCSQPSPSVDITEFEDPVCTVSLREASVGGFVGSTPAQGCAASVRGAVSITNVVVLHSQGMDTWDRGFNAEGEQVWGAEEIPYRYRR